jgi:hypothetical protein
MTEMNGEADFAGWLRGCWLAGTSSFCFFVFSSARPRAPFSGRTFIITVVGTGTFIRLAFIVAKLIIVSLHAHNYYKSPPPFH